MRLNPYAYALGGRDPVTVMAETPERLAALVGRMSAEDLERRPAPEKWNVRGVLAHLADCEIAFGFRLRQTAAGEKLIQPFDQDAWARVYGAYSVTAAMLAFTALRAWNVAFVAGLTDADRELTATHPERGTMTLWTIVETMAGHDLHHLKQLTGNS